MASKEALATFRVLARATVLPVFDDVGVRVGVNDNPPTAHPMGEHARYDAAVADACLAVLESGEFRFDAPS